MRRARELNPSRRAVDAARGARPTCVLLGGGGHARVVIESLRSTRGPVPAAILDPDRSLWGTAVLGVPVMGGDDLLPELKRRGVLLFVVGVGGTGDNGPRQRLFEHATSCGLTPVVVRHASAVQSPSATVGAGAVLLPLAVVNAGAVLGVNVIVNSGAVIEHDCAVADHVHVATGARLAGGVRVGEGAHVGAGATVREGLKIGAWAIVGAGAVVVDDVAARTVVVGSPARLLRNLGHEYS